MKHGRRIFAAAGLLFIASTCDNLSAREPAAGAASNSPSVASRPAENMSTPFRSPEKSTTAHRSVESHGDGFSMVRAAGGGYLSANIKLWAAIFALAAALSAVTLWQHKRISKLRGELDRAQGRSKTAIDSARESREQLRGLGERLGSIEATVGDGRQPGAASRPPHQRLTGEHRPSASNYEQDAPEAWGRAARSPGGAQTAPPRVPAPEPRTGLGQIEQVMIQAVANGLDPDDYEGRLKSQGDLRNAVERNGTFQVSDRYVEDPSAEIVAVVLHNGLCVVLPSSDYIRNFAGNSNVHSAPLAIRAGFDLAASGESRLALGKLGYGRLLDDGSITDFRKGELRGFSGGQLR